MYSMRQEASRCAWGCGAVPGVPDHVSRSGNSIASGLGDEGGGATALRSPALARPGVSAVASRSACVQQCWRSRSDSVVFSKSSDADLWWGWW